MMEMLRCRTPLLIVGHQAILRCLYAYLTRKSPEDCPTLSMPLHTVIKLTPKAYSCEEQWRLPLEEMQVHDAKKATSD
jgi:broad specificity phosphatase PhoE